MLDKNVEDKLAELELRVRKLGCREKLAEADVVEVELIVEELVELLK